VRKVFQGGTERALLDRLKRAFTTVKHVKPPGEPGGIGRDVRRGAGVSGVNGSPPIGAFIEASRHSL